MQALTGMVHGLIRGYQRFISPFLPMSCRFYPSCSEYAGLAITHYGIVKGFWKAMGRLSRCHPWSDGGYDPVLPKEEKE